MAKLSLGKPPKTFSAVVRFPMLDGSEGTIACSFRYRTLTEYGAFIDALQAAAGIAPGSEVSTLASMLERTRDKNGEYLLKILEGWDLEVPLSAESAQQLCDEFPGALAAIVDAYRAAIVEGRRGN